MVYGLKFNKKEKITMNLKKTFPFGFIVCCLLGHTMAMEKANDNSGALKTFKCPTIDEIHTHAKEIKVPHNYTEQSFTLTTNEGIIFEARLSNINRNTVQRALNIKRFKSVSIIKKGVSKQNEENLGGGYIHKVLIWYTSDTAQDFALKLDQEKMGINPGNISYSIPASSKSTSYYRDDEQYIHFEDPNLLFTIRS